MKYTIADALEQLETGCQYNIDGTEYSDIVWLDSSQTPPTEKQVNDKITELDNAEPMKLLRDERNLLLSESDWIIVKSQETGVAISNEWKTYRQALRDMPTNKTTTYQELANNLTHSDYPTEPS